MLFQCSFVYANSGKHGSEEGDGLDVRSFILHHVADSYEWHITSIGEREIAIPLPVILYSKTSGWNVFMSSVFHHHTEYKGFSIAHEGAYEGKFVELNAEGEQVRPFDISITKNALSLLISSTLLIVLIMSVVRSYRKHGFGAKKGFTGMMELVIMNINDDVIKPCVGKDYRKFAPYLLTLFFFVLLNNLLGLIPVFPGGANVTGNIAITGVLAIVTFLIVNISGSREYWKEIFWPDVPLWLKMPPMLPLIELVGIFTKPFALMIRLFANILAGHSIVLGLTCLIFVTVKLGVAGNVTMTGLSVVFSIFIAFVELLVAYIQAYIFTMLSAVFIGLARVESHHKKKDGK
jgi:F-type H+-transporting ATPase subunit a